jgi:hypothetical protein
LLSSSCAEIGLDCLEKKTSFENDPFLVIAMHPFTTRRIIKKYGKLMGFNILFTSDQI